MFVVEDMESPLYSIWEPCSFVVFYHVLTIQYISLSLDQKFTPMLLNIPVLAAGKTFNHVLI